MKPKYQNFKDFCDNCGRKKVDIYRELKQYLPIAYNTFNSWQRGLVTPTDPKKLEVLSKITNIPVEDLF